MIPVWAALCTSGVIVFSAWAYGSTETRAWTTVQAGVGTSFVLLCVLTLMTREGRRVLAGWLAPGWAVPAVLVLAYMVVQALNASHIYSSKGSGLTPISYARFLPHSTDCRTTLLAAAKLVTYCVVFATARAAAESFFSRQAVLWIVIGSGTAMAVLACLQYLAPTHELSLPLTGRFVNPNNYAAYANLLLPVALAFGRYTQVRARTQGLPSHPGHLFYLAGAVLFLSVFLSGSRAGTAVSAAVVVCWVAVEFIPGLNRRELPGGKAWIGLAVPVVLVVGFVSLFGTGPLRKELGKTQRLPEQVGQRLMAYEATAHMFRENWLYGIGGGTFSHAFPYYQPPAVKGFYRYTHNDWLQYLTELGLVGTGLLAALGIGALSGSVPGLWRRKTVADPAFKDTERKSPHSRRRAEDLALEEICLGRGLTVALGGVALHALVDFPCHIPAIAILTTVWVAMLARLRSEAASGRLGG